MRSCGTRDLSTASNSTYSIWILCNLIGRLSTPGGPVCRQVKRCRFHLDQFSRVEEPNQRMSCNNRRYTRNPQISRQGRWRSLSRKRSFSLLKHRHRRFSFLRVSGAYLPRGLFLYTYTCLSFHLSLFLLFSFVFRFHVVFFPFNFCSSLSLPSVIFCQLHLGTFVLFSIHFRFLSFMFSGCGIFMLQF